MACAEQVQTVGVGARAWLLDEDRRLHLQHGPIDLIVDAVGPVTDVHQAYTQAADAFAGVLDSLAGQLPLLRAPLVFSALTSDQHRAQFHGEVAGRMARAAAPFAGVMLTPMIAVAGSVADYVLEQMIKGCRLQRVQVNNGGDIALFLAEGNQVRVGICNDPEFSLLTNIITLKHEDHIAGVATSGWRGRSFSLGIADAVTVLSRDAASADCAATLIANAVDLPDLPDIQRVPANTLSPDSDLGEQQVTVGVPPLLEKQKEQALQSGWLRAQHYVRDGLIHSACLHLQGQTLIAGIDRFQTQQTVNR